MQGDEGDNFYIVDSGQVDVFVDDQQASTLGEGVPPLLLMSTCTSTSINRCTRAPAPAPEKRHTRCSAPIIRLTGLIQLCVEVGFVSVLLCARSCGRFKCVCMYVCERERERERVDERESASASAIVTWRAVFSSGERHSATNHFSALRARLHPCRLPAGVAHCARARSLHS